MPGQHVAFGGSQVLSSPKGPSDKWGMRKAWQLRPRDPGGSWKVSVASTTADVSWTLYSEADIRELEKRSERKISKPK